MILIAHRGNLNGKQPERENSPEYIKEALEKGYHVEVDVWLKETNNLFLGHDSPK
jgi:glycerophosphoryl diester phosphodiesterase